MSIDISCESSAKQMIHMKCQNLFSMKYKKKEGCLLLILFDALTVFILYTCITVKTQQFCVNIPAVLPYVI